MFTKTLLSVVIAAYIVFAISVGVLVAVTLWDAAK